MQLSIELLKRGWVKSELSVSSVTFGWQVDAALPLILKGEIMLFNLREIKEAVDFATGDDGFRSNEVIEILKQMKKENNNESKRKKNN